MVRGDDEPVAVKLPGVIVAVYPDIAAPPLLKGGVNCTIA
jgi:hypothetical protein